MSYVLDFRFFFQLDQFTLQYTQFDLLWKWRLSTNSWEIVTFVFRSALSVYGKLVFHFFRFHVAGSRFSSLQPYPRLPGISSRLRFRFIHAATRAQTSFHFKQFTISTANWEEALPHCPYELDKKYRSSDSFREKSIHSIWLKTMD